MVVALLAVGGMADLRRGAVPIPRRRTLRPGVVAMMTVMGVMIVSG
ncbi:hypothetical protein [Elioraea sp. Yellowstone]|nr:hypothetical protein [Elioraea sp. Yellowstone]